MLLMRFNLASSTPAASNIFLIAGSLACHQRICSLRSSLITTRVLVDRKFARLICMLKRVQSGRVSGPDPTDLYFSLGALPEAVESPRPLSSASSAPSSRGGAGGLFPDAEELDPPFVAVGIGRGASG